MPVAFCGHGTIKTELTRRSHYESTKNIVAVNQPGRRLGSVLQVAVIAFAIVACLPRTGLAQDPDIRSLHWAYASYFGTGWYSVGDNRDAYVLRMTPRWKYREASISESGDRSIGIFFKFPVTAGLETFDLDDPLGAVDPDNLASLSVTPGIDIEIPLTQRFTLRPYAAIGWGSALDGSESAWSYWAGIRSRYSFQSGKLDWALLNSVAYVGYTPSEGSTEVFCPLMIGLEFEYPLGEKKDEEGAWLLYWHGTYTSYAHNLDFLSPDSSGVQPISDEWEVAVALGKKDQRMQIWFMNFDRLGLGYRTSSDGQLRGITFIFRSVFDL